MSPGMALIVIGVIVTLLVHGLLGIVLALVGLALVVSGR